MLFILEMYFISESVREPCVDKGFVPLFLNVLKELTDIEKMTQACRALGNMCFDNGKR